MKATIFGIKNCDTVRKARQWLADHQLGYQFHDFRKDGLTPAQVNQWLTQIPAEILLNKRGTTWRKLDSKLQQKAETAELTQLLCDHPTLIKRPVLVFNNKILVGFSADQYANLFTTN